MMLKNKHHRHSKNVRNFEASDSMSKRLMLIKKWAKMQLLVQHRGQDVLATVARSARPGHRGHDGGITISRGLFS